jgi:hypothetical protein
MNKAQLIEKVLLEVQDEKLRDSLLKKIAEDDQSDTTGIINLLEKQGIDTAKAAGLLKSQMKIGSMVGQFIGSIFFVGGLCATIGMFSAGYLSQIFIPLFFCLIGGFAFFSSRKLSKVVR